MSQLSKIATLDQVVGLHEDLSQARLSDGIVLQIELVESMERVLMRVHVERVDGQVVGRQIKRLEDLLQRKLLAVTKDDDVLHQNHMRCIISIMSKMYAHADCASSCV